MGRGSRAIKRWRNDRQRKKKAREKRAPRPRSGHAKPLLDRLDVRAAAARPLAGETATTFVTVTSPPSAVDHVADLRRVALPLDELVAARPPRNTR